VHGKTADKANPILLAASISPPKVAGYIERTTAVIPNQVLQRVHSAW